MSRRSWCQIFSSHFNSQNINKLGKKKKNHKSGIITVSTETGIMLLSFSSVSLFIVFSLKIRKNCTKEYSKTCELIIYILYDLYVNYWLNISVLNSQDLSHWFFFRKQWIFFTHGSRGFLPQVRELKYSSIFFTGKWKMNHETDWQIGATSAGMH